MDRCVAVLKTMVMVLGLLMLSHSGVSFAADADMSKVVFTVLGSATLTPAAPPLDSDGIAALDVSFTLRVDKTEATTFAYDRSKWIIGFKNAATGGDIYESAATVTSTGDQTISGDEDDISVSLRILFESGDLPEAVKTMLNDAEKAGRRQLIVAAIYRPGTDKSNQKVALLTWAADLGVIRGAPKALAPEENDGMMALRWKKPTDLAAMVPSNGALVASGTSTVSGYLIAYWNQSDCAANGSGWAFRGNPTLDQNSGGREFTCSYADSTAAADSGKVSSSACGFGCETGSTSGLSGKTLEDAAVPFEIPDEGSVGNVVTSGCYYVVRIAGTGASTETYSLADLSNGERYGAVVYALDSSGHVSLGRSACMYGTPILIPLRGEGKDGVKRSESDCFVVSAASGDSESAMVQKWRLIRDHVIGRGAFVTWYYKHGPQMARWLDDRPWLKGAANWTLGVAADAIWTVRETWRDVTMRLSRYWKQVTAVSAGLLVSEAYAEDNPQTGAGYGDVGSNMQILGGYTTFTKDTKAWDADLKNEGKKTKPYRLFLGHSFSVWESRAGELGLGAGFSYLSARGEIPKSAKNPDGTPVGAAAVGADFTVYGYGAYGVMDYRLRIPFVPWVSPRIAVGGGMERVRRELVMDEAALSASDVSFPRGLTVNKKMMLVRGALEIYLSEIFTEDISSARMGYGLQDMGLSVFYDMHTDYTDKGTAIDSTTLGGGLSLLFQ